jgi:hypothetical protein
MPYEYYTVFLYAFSSFWDISTEEANAFVTVTPRAHYPNLFTITSETSVKISVENTGRIFNLCFQHGTCHRSIHRTGSLP